MNRQSSKVKTDLEKLRLRVIELEKREKKLLNSLRLNMSLHSKILDALPINVFLEDAEGRTIFANEQACKENGLKLEELVGKTVFDLFPHHIAEKQREIDLEVWRKRTYLMKEAMVGFQGKESYMLTGKTIIQLDGSQKEFLLGFGIDITDQKKAEEKIAHMAYHDPLTGLPNRWFIKTWLKKYQTNNEHAKKMAVLMLDLDYFKVINDSLGHDAGDQLLVEVAKRLKAVAGDENILARFGGDEFILLIPNALTSHVVCEICEKILEAMEEPFSVYGQTITISTSIGISLYPKHGQDMDSLIKNADLAMYHSKDHGRNCYTFFAQTMKENAIVRMDMEVLLRQAIERNEFVLYYQPKLDLKSGSIYTMEALIRWRNEDGTILYPDSFIPIAEESGLIDHIGEWVLREACFQCKKWHDEGFSDMKVSVNISPRQFQNQDLEELVRSILCETSLAPAALELELTEGSVMKEPLEAAALLKKLKALGITICIDDFGSGFSSLGYLKQFPIDILKIDKSFIMNLEWDQANAAIASAVISLAHNLNLKVVAEGVETEAQLNFLKMKNCDFVQGYFISRPIEITSSLSTIINQFELGYEKKSAVQNS